MIKGAIEGLSNAEKIHLLQWVHNDMTLNDVSTSTRRPGSATKSHAEAIANIRRLQRESLVERMSEFDSSGSITRDPF